jgi:hypothetical protein
VSKSEKYVPKHRSAPAAASLAQAPRRALRTTLVLTGVAAAVTGVSVASGVWSTPTLAPAAGEAPTTSAPTPAQAALTGAELERRTEPGVSRSSRRSADPAKKASLSAQAGPAVTRNEDVASSDPREIAQALLPEFGFDASQFSCLDALYVSESDWRIDADNPTSSAYGIPQALTEMHELPADYMTSAEAQIRWGLGYIQDSYGTPCSAWGFKQGHGWY